MIVLMFAVLFFAGCDEELPPRSDPENIFGGDLTTTYVHQPGGAGKPGVNGIYIIARIANNYDETISGEMLFDGTLQLEWVIPKEQAGNISTIRTAKLSTTSIISAKNFNSIKNELVFGPHDTIKVAYLWDFKFDDGTDARTVPAFWEGQKNIGCGNTVGLNVIPRMVYPSHEFRIQGKLQIFKKLSVIIFPQITVNTCTINFYPDVPCTSMAVPINGGSPCTLR